MKPKPVVIASTSDGQGGPISITTAYVRFYEDKKFLYVPTNFIKKFSPRHVEDFLYRKLYDVLWIDEKGTSPPTYYKAQILKLGESKDTLMESIKGKRITVAPILVESESDLEEDDSSSSQEDKKVSKKKENKKRLVEKKSDKALVSMIDKRGKKRNKDKGSDHSSSSCSSDSEPSNNSQIKEIDSLKRKIKTVSDRLASVKKHSKGKYTKLEKKFTKLSEDVRTVMESYKKPLVGTPGAPLNSKSVVGTPGAPLNSGNLSTASPECDEDFDVSIFFEDTPPKKENTSKSEEPMHTPKRSLTFSEESATKPADFQDVTTTEELGHKITSAEGMTRTVKTHKLATRSSPRKAVAAVAVSGKLKDQYYNAEYQPKIPASKWREISKPGTKNSHFVKGLASAIMSNEYLIKRTVCGEVPRRTKNMSPEVLPAIDQKYIDFIHYKLAERLDLKMSEFFVAVELQKINQYLNQKCNKLRETAKNQQNKRTSREKTTEDEISPPQEIETQ